MKIIEKQEGCINGTTYEVQVVEQLNKWFVAGMVLLYAVFIGFLYWIIYLMTLTKGVILWTTLIIGVSSITANLINLSLYLLNNDSKPKSKFIRFMVYNTVQVEEYND